MMKTTKKCSLLLSLLLCIGLASCEKGQEPTYQGDFTLYGMSHPFTSAVIWQTMPNDVTLPVEYTFEDRYIDPNTGQERVDRIKGIRAGEESIRSGMFVLSLFEDGLYLDDVTKTLGGDGGAISIRFASPEMESLVSGEYLCTTGVPRPKTFEAYVSSYIESADRAPIRPAAITKGTCEVSLQGNSLQVRLTGETDSGAPIQAQYSGPARLIKRIQTPVEKKSDIKLDALRAQVWVKQILNYAGGVVVENYVLDGAAKAFINVAAGTPVNVNLLRGNLETPEIALFFDESTKEYVFMSPIKMRQYTGRKADRDFTNHTLFMRAPAAFSESDFSRLEETGIHFEIKDEEVRFKSDEKPFVFFMTPKGQKGVIAVREAIPAIPYSESLYGGMVEVESTRSPALSIEIKATSQPHVPKIMF